ncbi:MAG: stage III sporulation protein AF [Clostridia bacterium]|nr:stage III sporulation protein AF [Clostridia bacterium]
MTFISNWAQGIIVSVITATIIEMLLPKNGNGKYVKVVIGVFVLFSIVSPIISKVRGGNNDVIEFDSYLENAETSNVQATSVNINNENAIKSMYEENLKVDIKSKINQKGYTVGEIQLDILNDTQYTLNKIDIKITGKNEATSSNENTQKATTIIENIENVKINLGGSAKDNGKQEEQSVISESEKRKLKEYISSVYEVNENNILIR